MEKKRKIAQSQKQADELDNYEGGHGHKKKAKQRFGVAAVSNPNIHFLLGAAAGETNDTSHITVRRQSEYRRINVKDACKAASVCTPVTTL